MMGGGSEGGGGMLAGMFGGGGPGGMGGAPGGGGGPGAIPGGEVGGGGGSTGRRRLQGKFPEMSNYPGGGGGEVGAHPGAAAAPGTPPAGEFHPGHLPPDLNPGDPTPKTAPPPTLDDGRSMPGHCVPKPQCPSVPAYLELTVTLVGMTYQEFNHKRRTAFREVMASEAKVKVQYVKLNKVKMLLERRRLSGGGWEDAHATHKPPTGLRVSVTLTCDQVDSVKI